MTLLAAAKAAAAEDLDDQTLLAMAKAAAAERDVKKKASAAAAPAPASTPAGSFQDNSLAFTNGITEALQAAMDNTLDIAESAAGSRFTEAIAESISSIFENLSRKANELAEAVASADIEAHRLALKAQANSFHLKMEASRTSAKVSMQNQAADMQANFNTQLDAKIGETGISRELKEAEAKIAEIQLECGRAKSKQDRAEQLARTTKALLENAQVETSEVKAALDKTKSENKRIVSAMTQMIELATEAAHADTESANACKRRIEKKQRQLATHFAATPDGDGDGDASKPLIESLFAEMRTITRILIMRVGAAEDAERFKREYDELVSGGLAETQQALVGARAEAEEAKVEMQAAKQAADEMQTELACRVEELTSIKEEVEQSRRRLLEYRTRFMSEVHAASLHDPEECKRQIEKLQKKLRRELQRFDGEDGKESKQDQFDRIVSDLADLSRQNNAADIKLRYMEQLRQTAQALVERVSDLESSEKHARKTLMATLADVEMMTGVENMPLGEQVKHLISRFKHAKSEVTMVGWALERALLDENLDVRMDATLEVKLEDLLEEYRRQRHEKELLRSTLDQALADVAMTVNENANLGDKIRQMLTEFQRLSEAEQHLRSTVRTQHSSLHAAYNRLRDVERELQRFGGAAAEQRQELVFAALSALQQLRGRLGMVHALKPGAAKDVEDALVVKKLRPIASSSELPAGPSDHLSMVFGVRCVCCGKQEEREQPEASSLFFCEPCSDDDALDLSLYTMPQDTGVVVLEASKAFDMLTPKEQKYAYGIAKASWEGAKICLIQTSPESAAIFTLLQLVFSAQPVEELTAAAKTKGLSDAEIEQAMIYVASFYGNLGNYKNFGDTKFVPALPPERMELFVKTSSASATKVAMLWNVCAERLYSLTPRQRQLGLGAAKGISTYFSANCDEADAEFAGRFLESVRLVPYNTRLLKSADGRTYTVLIASGTTTQAAEDNVGLLCRKHHFEGKTFMVRRGDHAALMSRAVAGLELALPHVDNDHQRAMLESYIESFEFGSIEAHKEGSRAWIKDKGPAVESYIGFIESYRDPSGARGEWEGFVACVNREVSRKFQTLVDGAESMLKLMPWPAAFEKDKFLRPDFTSLEVLAFGSSGVPAGINIPNYDDIRQCEGFKNVSLGNVLAASYGSGAKPVTFVRDSDQKLYKALQREAFEIQVGIHELLGHGSGKLYHGGTVDAEALVKSKEPNPLTGDPITGPFYSTGATWDTTFGKVASSYEECRAECSGIYLCLEPLPLSVFGHTPDDDSKMACGVHDISYINWLLMVRAGLCGLEFYTPETGGWRQAHMRARFVILRVLLEAGEGLVALKRTTGADGEPDLEINLDRAKIATVGKAAIGKFFLALQVHKSLGDVTVGTAMYEKYSHVDEDMIGVRKIVMARKEQRKLVVQPVLQMDVQKNVQLKTFDATPAGMIESFVARFPAEDPALYDLYENELPYMLD